MYMDYISYIEYGTECMSSILLMVRIKVINVLTTELAMLISAIHALARESGCDMDNNCLRTNYALLTQGYKKH